MTQSTLIAIGTMLNAFPAAQGDVDVLVRSFEAATENVDPGYVCEAAKRFMTGEVKDHNPKYAPTVAEFAIEARRVAELKQAIARPRLAPPEYPRSDTPPYKIKEAKIRERYRDWTLHADNVSLEQFKAMVATKQVPSDATWIGALSGSVLIPPRKQA